MRAILCAGTAVFGSCTVRSAREAFLLNLGVLLPVLTFIFSGVFGVPGRLPLEHPRNESDLGGGEKPRGGPPALAIKMASCAASNIDRCISLDLLVSEPTS